MLTPLSLRGDQGHSLLLRMPGGSLLCAIQAKHSVFDSLDDSRFDPAGAHPKHIVLLHRSVGLNRKVRRFTWKRSQSNICDHRRGLVELAVRTTAPMASDDLLHSDNLQLGPQQVCVRESTSNYFVPRVVLLAEQRGKTLQLGACG